jgi:uncharacterized protein YdhG (YjbR/CyaY superfamily)
MACPHTDYLDQLPPERAAEGRRVLDLMAAELPDADRDVRWGIARFRLNGRDVVGLAVRGGFYSLYVPHGSAHAAFSSRLGKVDCGKGCIRYSRPEELDLDALRGLVRACRAACEAP